MAAIVLSICAWASAWSWAWGWGAGAARADEGVATPDVSLTFGETTEVAWVLVPTIVRDDDGFVDGLDAGDFRLFVDGRPTSIESFDAGADAPFTVVFLQDLSGSMANAGKIDAGRRALESLADAAGAGDRLAVVGFASGTVEVEVPFTGDLDAVREAAERWRPYGSTSLHDAIAWVPELQLAARSGRLAAVVVTDGVDNASVLEPSMVRAVVEAAEVPVYVLALRGSRLDARGGSTDVPLAVPAIEEGEWTARYATVLQRLAAATTGRYLEIRTRTELEAAVAAILEELRSQYTLSFRASGVGPDARRALRVEVARSGVEVAHRAGYVGTSP